MHRMTAVGLALTLGAGLALLNADKSASPAGALASAHAGPVVLAISRGRDLVLAGARGEPGRDRHEAAGRRSLSCDGVVRLAGVTLGVGCGSMERLAQASGRI